MCKLLLTTTVILLIYISNESGSVISEKNINSSFVATHQWQKVKNGQALPPGLHIRVNLHTGEKEAKLPEPQQPDNNDKKSLIEIKKTTTTKTTTNDEKQQQQLNDNSYKFNELKKLLKNIKSEEPENVNEIKKNFKSYDKLKEEFESLKINVKTDVELLVGLIDNFRHFNLKLKYANNASSNWTKDEDVLVTLKDLEYLVHQYDNAQEFAKLNGFSDVVYKSLNSTNSDIRSEALKLLGSATQNNPKVQIAALESGSINLLLKILTFDDDHIVKSRSLFALFSLVRRFPAAQEKLIADGGLTAFAKIFDDDKRNQLKLQIKIVILIHSLLYEKKDVTMTIRDRENNQHSDSEMNVFVEKLKQYGKINLEQKLVEQDWCGRISKWFTKQNFLKDLPLNPDMNLSIDNLNFDIQDVLDEVINTLFMLSDVCKSQFERDQDLLQSLKIYKNVYDDLALQEKKTNSKWRTECKILICFM